MGRLGPAGRARARRGPADCADGLILAHDALVQQLLHMEQALAFVLRHLLTGTPVQLATSGDILLGDHVVVLFCAPPRPRASGDVLTGFSSSSAGWRPFQKS